MRPTEKVEKFLRKNSISSNPKANKAVLNELIDEMEKTQQASESLNIGRIIMKSKISQLAAAAVIIIAAVIGALYFTRTSDGIAWADIVKPIFTAETVKYDMIIGQEGSGAAITDMVKGSRIRRNVEGTNQASIIDLESSKVMVLEETTKTALYIDLKNLPSIPNYTEHLKNLITKLENSPEFKVKKLGKKIIDGKEAVGFLATGFGIEVTIWADAETAVPIRIEQKENNLNVICKNYQFDIEMDDSLFSMEIPQGYKEQTVSLDLTGSTEEDFIAGLRIFAEITPDKQFPPDISIEYIAKNAVQIGMLIEKAGLSEDKPVEMGEKLSKMVMFIRFFNVHGQGQWHYAGSGVKLGDASKAIFWYQPKESQTWRVIYGDLSVKDVNKEDLPN